MFSRYETLRNRRLLRVFDRVAQASIDKHRSVIGPCRLSRRPWGESDTGKRSFAKRIRLERSIERVYWRESGSGKGVKIIARNASDTLLIEAIRSRHARLLAGTAEPQLSPRLESSPRSRDRNFSFRCRVRSSRDNELAPEETAAVSPSGSDSRPSRVAAFCLQKPPSHYRRLTPSLLIISPTHRCPPR